MANKKGKRKGACPRCGVPMKLKRRYCTSCGCPNPLLVRGPVRRRPAPAAVKSAGGSYAPVVPLRPSAAPRRDPRWTEILSNPDPDARQRLTAVYFPNGGGAA